jgi:hypothetical protein
MCNNYYQNAPTPVAETRTPAQRADSSRHVFLAHTHTRRLNFFEAFFGFFSGVKKVSTDDDDELKILAISLHIAAGNLRFGFALQLDSNPNAQ